MKKLLIALMLVATLSVSAIAIAGSSLPTYTDQNGKQRVDFKSVDKQALSGGESSDMSIIDGSEALGTTVGGNFE